MVQLGQTLILKVVQPVRPCGLCHSISSSETHTFLPIAVYTTAVCTFAGIFLLKTVCLFITRYLNRLIAWLYFLHVCVYSIILRVCSDKHDKSLGGSRPLNHFIKLYPAFNTLSQHIGIEPAPYNVRKSLI